MLTRYHVQILDELAEHKAGISFNKLAEALRGRASRAVVSRELRKLVARGIVTAERDPRHSQRRIFKLRGDLMSTLAALEAEASKLAEGGLEPTLKLVRALVKWYAEVAKAFKDEALRAYLRHRALLWFDRALRLL